MKRIVIFHPEFAYSGGAEKMTFEQIDYLKKKGYKVRCFTAFVDKRRCFPNRIENYDIRQILPNFLNKIIPHDLMIMATTLAFPMFIFSFKNYDVYLGENQAACWWAFFASFFWRKPFLTYQNYPTSFVYPREIDKNVQRNTFIVDLLISILKPLIVPLDKFVIRSADVSFANGEHAKSVCKRAYGRKFVNCPGGTKLGVFTKSIFSRRYSGSISVNRLKVKKPYILVINRHFPAKRLEYGIEVLSRLAKSYPQLTMVIVGPSTAYTKKLKSLVKKYRLDKKVVFPGLVVGKEVNKLYQNALVYIYTAPEEDFGLGILESMARGVPVVVWDKAGPSYIVKNNVVGFKIPPGNLDEFTKEVKRLISDRDLNFKMAKAAYSESKRFSWEEHGRILDSWLMKTLKMYKR